MSGEHLKDPSDFMNFGQSQQDYSRDSYPWGHQMHQNLEQHPSNHNHDYGNQDNYTNNQMHQAYGNGQLFGQSMMNSNDLNKQVNENEKIKDWFLGKAKQLRDLIDKHLGAGASKNQTGNATNYDDLETVIIQMSQSEPQFLIHILQMYFKGRVDDLVKQNQKKKKLATELKQYLEKLEQQIAQYKTTGEFPALIGPGDTPAGSTPGQTKTKNQNKNTEKGGEKKRTKKAKNAEGSQDDQQSQGPQVGGQQDQADQNVGVGRPETLQQNMYNQGNQVGGMSQEMNQQKLAQQSYQTQQRPPGYPQMAYPPQFGQQGPRVGGYPHPSMMNPANRMAGGNMPQNPNMMSQQQHPGQYGGGMRMGPNQGRDDQDQQKMDMFIGGGNNNQLGGGGNQNNMKQPYSQQQQIAYQNFIRNQNSSAGNEHQDTHSPYVQQQHNNSNNNPQIFHQFESGESFTKGDDQVKKEPETTSMVPETTKPKKASTKPSAAKTRANTTTTTATNNAPKATTTPAATTIPVSQPKNNQTQKREERKNTRSQKQFVMSPEPVQISQIVSDKSQLPGQFIGMDDDIELNTNSIAHNRPRRKMKKPDYSLDEKVSQEAPKDLKAKPVKKPIKKEKPVKQEPLPPAPNIDVNKIPDTREELAYIWRDWEIHFYKMMENLRGEELISLIQKIAEIHPQNISFEHGYLELKIRSDNAKMFGQNPNTRLNNMSREIQAYKLYCSMINEIVQEAKLRRSKEKAEGKKMKREGGDIVAKNMLAGFDDENQGYQDDLRGKKPANAKVQPSTYKMLEERKAAQAAAVNDSNPETKLEDSGLNEENDDYQHKREYDTKVEEQSNSSKGNYDIDKEEESKEQDLGGGNKQQYGEYYQQEQSQSGMNYQASGIQAEEDEDRIGGANNKEDEDEENQERQSNQMGSYFQNEDRDDIGGENIEEDDYNQSMDHIGRIMNQGYGDDENEAGDFETKQDYGNIDGGNQGFLFGSNFDGAAESGGNDDEDDQDEKFNSYF